MLKDIPQLTVENICVAVVREIVEGEQVWNVYVVNLYPTTITNVMVSSTGYGLHKGKDVKTSTLRHMIGDIDTNDYGKIEPIIEELFGLTNEFWISFFHNGHMYDKKYIFLPESIKEENFVTVPVLGKKGVMIR